MQKNYCINLTTRIEFGNGKRHMIGQFAEELGGTHALLITDAGLSKTEIVSDVIKSLQASKIKYILFDGTRENPRDIDAQSVYNETKDCEIDLVIGCGGGSSMDLAKAVAALFTNGGVIEKIINPNKLAFSPLPVICVPTTAGTGSEVTSFAVLTLEKEQRKSSVFDEKVRSNIAINDPEVLYSVPASVAAATGMDALTHAVEAYTCKVSNRFSDGMALHAIKLISENIYDFVYNRTTDNCEAMMTGSLMAGIAFGFSDIAGVHCMAEALGGVFDIPHGVANSIFLPIVFEYNIEADVKRHSDVAIALGINSQEMTELERAMQGVTWITRMSKELHIPKLNELKAVNRESFNSLADKCMKNVSLKSNARELNKDDFVLLYEKANKA